MSESSAWQVRRREAAQAHAEALDRRRAAEVARARDLVATFVRDMVEAGVPSQPLRARVPGRRVTYRTGLRGWYIRANRALAVTEDGEFYILDVPASLKARFVGVDLTPSDPPLVVGRGARDGESIDLAELLRRCLDQATGP
jgi:hypothetical protein